MTASNVAATQAVAYAFIDAQFPWLPKPKIIEWNNIAGGSQNYATDKTISVPKYSDAWNDGRRDIVIHETGHVVVYYCSTFGEVLTPFLTAMGGDHALRQHPLINEIIAEHFARAYVPGYTGINYPTLVGLVPFPGGPFVRAFFESLHIWPDIVLHPSPPPVVVPATHVVPPTTVVDYFSPKGADFMRCLVENGVSGIARYLVEHPMLDVRALTPAEVTAAHNAGLSIFLVFEMNPTYREYFTAQQGARDAASAMNHLDILGAPRGLTVYFAVDAPASIIHPESLDEYFNAIEGTLQLEAKGSRDPNDWRLWPGIYGFEAHVEYARKNFPNVGRMR